MARKAMVNKQKESKSSQLVNTRDVLFAVVHTPYLKNMEFAEFVLEI